MTSLFKVVGFHLPPPAPPLSSPAAPLPQHFCSGTPMALRPLAFPTPMFLANPNPLASLLASFPPPSSPSSSA